MVATALSWLGGLAVFLAVSMPLWHAGQALPVAVAVGLISGLLMAATMAAVTGFAVVRLDVPASRSRTPVRPARTYDPVSSGDFHAQEN